MENINICLFGAASSDIADIYLHEGEELGQEIGRRGHRLLYGGGTTGLMGACAKGAYACGGEVTGIAPDFFDTEGVLNKDMGELILTETMHQRKKLMEEKADAFIVCPGGIGTMDEFFQVLVLSSLGRKRAPIILYNICGYYDELIRFIDISISKGFARPGIKDLFRVCSDPAEAIDKIEYFS